MSDPIITPSMLAFAAVVILLLAVIAAGAKRAGEWR